MIDINGFYSEFNIKNIVFKNYCKFQPSKEICSNNKNHGELKAEECSGSLQM